MKLNRHAWILWGSALVAVLVLAFVIPFVKTSVYWLALACTLVMFAAMIAVFLRAFRRIDAQSTLESKLLGWPIFKVGTVALTVQIVLGFVLMALSTLCPLFVAVIAEVLVFAACAFCLTVKDAAREVVTATETKVEDTTAAWKAIRVKANALAATTGNADIKKLADEIRYADPTPTSLDGEIAEMLEKLSMQAPNENIQQILKLVSQRKMVSKSEK